MPEPTLAALRHLETANAFSDEVAVRGLIPIFLLNTLYLLVCWDAVLGRQEALYPLFEEGAVVLPICRWLDGVREAKNLSSDRALGEFLLPNYVPDNARREILKWRKGELPAWSAVQTIAHRENAEQIYETFAAIRILHGILSFCKTEEFKGAIEPRALFSTVPYLQKFASDRAKRLPEYTHSVM